ncbi:MAG: 50S ribosomal protein L21 [Bacteroidales bacterium]|jgi:large subunit ribosomal protein L21|nr:50S ribosomal protein L21 [Bacteroidales bacterium]MCK9311365.1 50S ribosomal protein L21 [Bacteroidales bacterium]
MYAIVEIAGQQFKAEAGKRLYVHRLEAERGSVVEFEKVLLIDADGTVKVGAPTVDGAKVVCEVLSHLKGDKVIIFKKKRRKGYRKCNGHRQYFTELKINEVLA